INNFYTATVYEKGAEIVRMLKVLLGPERFRQGMDLYFARHDGEAATVEQFVQCFADAAGVDLTQFQLWYAQAGTPEVVASGHYDPAARTYRLDLAQTVPPTPGQSAKAPMVIPLAVGLVGPDGSDLPLTLAGASSPSPRLRGEVNSQPAGGGKLERGVLVLRQRNETFVFEGVGAPPVPSLNRGFSAPVKLIGNLSA